MSNPITVFRYKRKDYHLTKTEYNFLFWICHDLTYSEIAKLVGRSPRSLDSTRDRLFELLDVKSRVGLILWCFKSGLFEISDIRLRHGRKKPPRKQRG